MSLTDKLAQERRGRLAAERLLDLKQAELFAANKKLGDHALALSNEIVDTRKEVEEVRSQAEALKGENVQVRSDLKIAKQRLWDSIQTIPDGFAVFDNDHRLVSANDAFMSIFDGLEEATIGITYGRALELLIEEGAIDVGDQPSAEWQAEMLERWNGTRLEPMTVKLWNGRFIKLMDRRAPGGDTVSLSMDITETIRYEAQLKDARRKAEAAARTKSAFLANMSHEIRTPMNGVVGMADLLLEDPLNDEQRTYVETIKNSGEALLVIINDVLDYSKIEAQKLELHPESFDLEAAILEVQRLLQTAAHEKGISIHSDIDLNLGRQFRGDPGRIRQVLINLAGNAVKFTTEGHVLIRVFGGETGQDDQVMVNVLIEDTGIGIREDQIDHVFGEFNQAEDAHSRKFDGTGLGLSITKQLIDLMGGEIWAESELGKGSTFGFQIPLICEEAMPDLPNLASSYKNAAIVGPEGVEGNLLGGALETLGIACIYAEQPDGLPDAEMGLIVLLDEPDGGLEPLSNAHPQALILAPGIENSDDAPLLKPLPTQRSALLELLASSMPEATEEPRQMRILAAEDNKTNRLVFSKMVQALDIDLQFANNGLEAVEGFQSFEPDLIFMDISMPEMDGKEATQKIREIEAESGGDTRVPVVAVTAHAMAGDAEEILAAGLDKYLTKPLRKKAILQEIQTHCPADCLPPQPEEPAMDAVAS